MPDFYNYSFSGGSIFNDDRHLVQDFVTTSAVADTFTLNTLGGAAVNIVDGEAQRDGVVSIEVGMLVTSKVAGVMATNMVGDFNGSFQKYFEAAFKIVDASDPVNKYYFAIGYTFDDGELSANTNIVALLYDPQNVSGLNAGLITNYILVTRNGIGNTTITDSGVAPTANWVKLGLLAADGEIQMYIDNELACSTADDIPDFASADKLTIAFHMSRNSVLAAAAAQEIYLDYIKFYTKNY